MSISRLFTLDRLQIELVSPTGAVAEHLSRFWQASFFLTAAHATVAESATESVGAGQTAPTVRVLLQTPGTEPLPIHDSIPIYTAVDLTVWASPVGFVLRCGASWLAVDLDAQCARGELDDGFQQTRPQDQRDFFLLMLLMLAHRNGYYGLHANGLSDGSHEYLVVGPSGSGKSTLTVQLVQQGWAYSGDDLLLLRLCPVLYNHTRTPQIRGYALRREFALSPRTLRHTSLTATDSCDATDDDKQIVRATRWEHSHVRPRLQPTRLLFSTIIDAAESALQPLQPAEALVMLVQQSAGIMTDSTVAGAQLGLLAQLTKQAEPYRLQLGRDVFTAPHTVATRLQSLPDRSNL